MARTGIVETVAGSVSTDPFLIRLPAVTDPQPQDPAERDKVDPGALERFTEDPGHAAQVYFWILTKNLYL